ncbi:hypothetical protein [Planctomyces sp. SH-PL14]|uniref:hypothetical protein n=1 Tax=Planctomyces sp. SH-PL14 TaxID=1632864 RepID=UPI00078EB515|nr:hypothetical protein [Planctomyces sp. SH-PL14]AMV21781.1 hypothetical protein VT03_28020 [Planctomyces sp. SH-PL14]
MPNDEWTFYLLTTVPCVLLFGVLAWFFVIEMLIRHYERAAQDFVDLAWGEDAWGRDATEYRAEARRYFERANRLCPLVGMKPRNALPETDADET